MTDQFTAIERRTQQYWYSDGITEIAVGLLLLFLGTFYVLPAVLSDAAPFTDLLSNSLLLIVVAWAILLNRIVNFLKERITYPRTGYVRYARKTKSRRASLLSGMIAGALFSIVGILLVKAPGPVNWIVALNGAIFSLGVYLLIGRRTGLLRFHIFAIFIFIIGAGLAWLSIDDFLSLGLLFIGMGLFTIVSGTLVLIHYLHTSSPAMDGQDD